MPIKISVTSEYDRKFFSIGYQLLEKDRYILRTFAMELSENRSAYKSMEDGSNKSVGIEYV